VPKNALTCDNDGVIDSYDICNDTPEGEIDNVLSNGCSPSEITVDPEADSTNKYYMTFNAISVGDVFQMGSPEEEFGRPQGGGEMLHDVQITKPFDLQTTEVTQYQWHAVLNAAEEEDISIANLVKQPSATIGCLTCPVENISWFEIQKFIIILNKLTLGAVNYRLPTEAEWEYVCRAGSDTAFSNGPTDIDQDEISLLYDITLDETGWFYDNSDDGFNASSRNKTHMVAEKKPNAWGFYDMHGNVWEFCSDWFVAYDSFNDPAVTAIDPIGSLSVSVSYTRRSARGGGATLQAYQCRSASRTGFAKGDDSQYTGFRLVREDE